MWHLMMIILIFSMLFIYPIAGIAVGVLYVLFFSKD